MMIKCNKSHITHSTPTDEDIKLINQYTRRKFTSDELYTFSVTLCDNEIDRDYEQFSADALKDFSNMFIGVTGISDHDPKASNQLARIYSCTVEKVAGRKNSVGEDYLRVVAKAYMPRNEKCEEFIELIDSGINKEVSIGCSIGKRYCSICGSDKRCGHIKGEYYKEKLCYQILSDPTDAYEWSFVAVPAQREAGVIKSFNKTEEKSMETIMKSLSSGDPVCLTKEEANRLYDEINELRKSAQLGKTYKADLVGNLVKLCSVAEPDMAKTMATAAEKMDVSELKSFCEHFSKKANEKLTPMPQLYKSKEKLRSKDNSKYSI